MANRTLEPIRPAFGVEVSGLIQLLHFDWLMAACGRFVLLLWLVHCTPLVIPVAS
jgi:hypothetical protein